MFSGRSIKSRSPVIIRCILNGTCSSCFKVSYGFMYIRVRRRSHLIETRKRTVRLV